MPTGSPITLTLRPRQRIGSIRLKYDLEFCNAKYSREASFESIDKLAQAFKDFTAVYNINARRAFGASVKLIGLNSTTLSLNLYN